MGEFDIAQTIYGLVFGGFFGFLIGLATFRFCQNRGSSFTGGIGFISCTLVGSMFGILGAAPTALLFILFAKFSEPFEHQSNKGDSRFLKSMGCLAVFSVGIFLFFAACLGFVYMEGKKLVGPESNFFDTIKAGTEKLEKENTFRSFRTFRSKDGRTLEGRIIAVEGSRVKIERKDGKTFETSIDIYSEPDQQFIRSSFP